MVLREIIAGPSIPVKVIIVISGSSWLLTGSANPAEGDLTGFIGHSNPG
jgi:hypothetical protein